MINNIKKKIQRIFLEEFKFWEVIILMGLTAVVGVTAGGFVVKKNYGITTQQGISSDLKEFISNYQYIVNNYYGSLDEEQLLNKALQTILGDIDDPYAAYMDEVESSNFDIHLSGSYQGIGLEIGNLKETNEIIITQIFDNSPAQKAGLQVGDIITKLNNESLTGVSSSDLSKRIKNLKDEFQLTVVREEMQKNITLKVGQIVLKSVDSKILNDDVGYISISIFADNTFEQMQVALDNLEKEEITDLIIDVRGNTGGYLTSVEKILGLFMDSSHIIYQTEDKNGIKKYYSKGKNTNDYNIVVLTDGASASASEILTAALKEELGAISVGKKTYGKGSAQKLHTLSDGTKYKFTTQKWLTPSGQSIDGVGIDVDIEVDMSQEYYQNPIWENDNQLQEAISYFKNND